MRALLLVAALGALPACELEVIHRSPPAPPSPPRVMSSELHFVFHHDGHTYMQLDTEQQAKIGDKVFVDTDCVATITCVTRVDRYPDYREQTEEGEIGMPPVLAAELDRCDGTYARSAALPRVVVPEPQPNDELLIARATRTLLYSQAADATTREWQFAKMTGDWRSQAQYDVRTLRHPLTNATWISIHAFRIPRCGGDTGINLWGLFRVEPDGSLAVLHLRNLDRILQIHHIIDIEGDGELELVGTERFGDGRVVRANGDYVQSLELVFDGFPC
jgi:hypothetical protein